MKKLFVHDKIMFGGYIPMKLSYQDLHKSFLRRTAWTNNFIAGGYQSGLSVMEETITNINLIEIATENKDFIITREFSRKVEGSTSGADWLWFIGEPGSWLPILVQAKLVNPNSLNCYHLNYRSGEQRRLLVEFARKHKFFPVYCIYSYIREDFHPNGKLSTSLSALEDYEWACSFISPKQVRQLIKQKQKNQINLLRFGIPWTFPLRYAVNCDNRSLANAIAEGFVKIQMELIELETGEKKTMQDIGVEENGPKNIRWENPDPRFLICQSIPKFVINAVQGKASSSQIPVAGISIISSVPVSEAIEHSGGFPLLDEGRESISIISQKKTRSKEQN